MSPSEEFGATVLDAGPDGALGAGDAAPAAPTHLLTMARGDPAAIPDRVVGALGAMGIAATTLAGRGLGLACAGDLPEFLRREPFHLEELAAGSDADAPEPEGWAPEDAAGGAAPDLAVEDLDVSSLAEAPGLPDLADLACGPEEQSTASDPALSSMLATEDADLQDADAAPDLSVPMEEVAMPDMPGADGSSDAPVEAEDDSQGPVFRGRGPGSLPGSATEEGVEESEAMPLTDGDPLGEEDEAALPAAFADRIMDRLELIEFMLAEHRDPAVQDEMHDMARQVEERLDRIEAALCRMEGVESRLGDGVSTLDGLCRRVEEATAQLARPGDDPSADGMQVVQDGLVGLEAATREMRQGISTLAESLEAGQARVVEEMRLLVGSDAPDDAGVGAGRIEVEAMSSVVAALSDQLAAARGTPRDDLAPILDALAGTQERIVSMLADLAERPETRVQEMHDKFMRDVRILFAELIAEDRRATVA